MGKAEKMLSKMRNNPRDWHIEDIKALAARHGISHRQPGTSHVTFRFPDSSKLTIPARKPIKSIYIKHFIEALDNLIGEKDDPVKIPRIHSPVD